MTRAAEGGGGGVAGQQGEDDLTIKNCKSERREKRDPGGKWLGQRGKGVAGQQGEDVLILTMKFKNGKSVRWMEGVGTKTDGAKEGVCVAHLSAVAESRVWIPEPPYLTSPVSFFLSPVSRA